MSFPRRPHPRQGAAVKGRHLKQLQAIGEERLPAGELRTLGDLYRQRGKWAEAVRCYQRVLTSLPDQHSVRLEAALCYIELGQTDQAMGELRQVVEKAPHYRNDAAALLGQCLTERQEPNALPELQQLAQTAPSIETNYYYGIGLLKNRNLKEAREIFIEIARQTPVLHRPQRRFAKRAKSLLRKCPG